MPPSEIKTIASSGDYPAFGIGERTRPDSLKIGFEQTKEQLAKQGIEVRLAEPQAFRAVLELIGTEDGNRLADELETVPHTILNPTQKLYLSLGFAHEHLLTRDEALELSDGTNFVLEPDRRVEILQDITEQIALCENGSYWPPLSNKDTLNRQAYIARKYIDPFDPNNTVIKKAQMACSAF